MREKHTRRLGAPQLGLWPLQLKTIILTKQKDFEGLFVGFTRLRAVSYAHSLDLLLEFVEQKGYSEVEWIAGDRQHIEDDYRRALASKGVEPILRLMNLMQAGAFQLWIPKRLIHSKFYLLSREDGVTRAVVGSPNFTNMANSGGQVNYACYMDFSSSDDPLLHQMEEDYAKHKNLCTLFLDNLVQLCEGKTEDEKRSMVQLWIQREEPAEGQVDREAQSIIKEAFRSAFQTPDTELLTITLPQSPESRKVIKRSLPELFSGSRGEAKVPPLQFLDLVQKRTGLPLMHISQEGIWLSNNGRRQLMSEAPTDPETVGSDLAALENYCQTVEKGHSNAPDVTKAGLFEALLYILASPFAHQYQIARRTRWPRDERGPRFLYLYGGGSNGKTTLLNYAYRLLSGYDIGALTNDQFTKSRIQNSAATESIFPLLFDDVTIPRSGYLPNLLKNYWGPSWESSHPVMQIVVTSNSARLDDWARARTKLINVSVHYTGTAEERDLITEVTSSRNSIFKWFSYQYLQLWNEHWRDVTDDELFVARLAMADLYKFARREPPGFFCRDTPLEQRYDQGREEWQGLLTRMKRATLEKRGDKLVVEFTPDVQTREIDHFQGLLPRYVSARRVGGALEIQTRDQFREWCGLGNTGAGWRRFRRVFKR